ncbi:MAG: haloacid dehalogenase-like hydrolase [Myxococcales bacterium]|nr:haloacid dehalogenase-like hydrolase [Myxococcales bacterium]
MAVVHHPDPKTVLALIDAVPAGGHIATDCDGTVWSGDVGDDLVIAAERDPARFGGAEISFDAYITRQQTDYEGACLSACEVLRNISEQDAAEALRDVVPDDFTGRRYMVEALQAAMARGVSVWLVSASPLLAVQVGAGLVGLESAGMIGIELDPKDGFVAPWPIGPGKAAAWRARGLPQPDLAFGDSKWDLPLLNSAATGVMLVPAPKDALVTRSAAEVRQAC